MTQRRELVNRLHKLGEIRNIMNSMKNLAYMETRKLSRLLGKQREMIKTLETVAADFLSFYSNLLPYADSLPCVLVLIGSERGFCGDFNTTLIERLESHLQYKGIAEPDLIVVGRKLSARLEKDPRVAAFVDGPDVAEEVERVLYQIVSEVDSLQKNYAALTLTVLYHSPENDDVTIQKLLPPFERAIKAPRHFSLPPVLNLTAEAFLLDLVDHYLIADLHTIVFTSLLAENQRRVQHLEGAVQRLDEEAEDLTRKSHLLRQEEITEEIEVVLLSATSDGRTSRGTLYPGKKRDT